jgi:hypothetical protein
MQLDSNITFYHIFIKYTYANISEFKYKMDISDLDFYSGVYSIKLKYILLNSTYMNRTLVLSLAKQTKS